jgi:hypothetical protein
MQRKNPVRDDILVEPVRMAYWKNPVRDDIPVENDNSKFKIIHNS